MTVTKKKEPPLDLLFQNFAGELIEILINKEVEQSKQTEDMIETLKHSMHVIGYFTDMDDKFLYLGLEPDTISQAINRNFIIHVEITTPDELDMMLQEAEAPKKPGDYN